MVDSRSLNAITATSAFNFKSGDISGTAAKMSDEKMGQGGEYFVTENGQAEAVQQNQPYIDRSAELRATLNSLAIMNVANMLANKKKQQIVDETVAENDEIDEHFTDIQSDENVAIDDVLENIEEDE